MKCTKIGKAKIYLGDCMDYMRDLPNNAFELAIVDPPYGIEKANKSSNPTSRIIKYGQMKTVNEYKPTKEYFRELKRVSDNQIIWGWNHLSDLLPTTKEFIFWFKHQPVKTYSDGEIAYTSFDKTAKCFNYPYFGGVGREKERIHPTQKPVALYGWLLKEYAKKGDKILDTHLGSGSSAIACNKLGFEMVGIELDENYYNNACERITNNLGFEMEEVERISSQPLQEGLFT